MRLSRAGRIIGMLLLLLAPGAPAMAEDKAAAGFLAGTEDVPLPPGLASEEQTLVVFDKPEGRIVEIEAKGRLTRGDVENFYEASLPQLGWTTEGKHAWRRGGEGLRLVFRGRDGDLRVGFTLSPR
jgi:hypothetical protein